MAFPLSHTRDRHGEGASAWRTARPASPITKGKGRSAPFAEEFGDPVSNGLSSPLPGGGRGRVRGMESRAPSSPSS